MKRNTTKFNAIKIRESKTDVYKSLYYGSYLCSNTIMNKKTSNIKTVLQELPQTKILFFDNKDR